MKYTVFHGYMHARHSGFNTFPEALACYIDHEDERPCPPRIVGEGYDFSTDKGEVDGLTDEEREAVEAGGRVAA